MNKFFTISIVFLFSIFIVSCSNGEVNGDNLEEETSFQATILENNGTYLAVQPEENSPENSSADQLHVSVSDAKLLDENDNETTIEDFLQDMKVNITYNGMIAESYPAQIHKVYEIKILPQN